MLGGMEQQIATDPFPYEIVVAIIGLIGTVGAAWLLSRKR